MDRVLAAQDGPQAAAVRPGVFAGRRLQLVVSDLGRHLPGVPYWIGVLKLA